MSKTATDDNLLTYEKYFDLQERFNSPYSKDDDGLNQKEFLDETEFKIKNRYVIRSILEKLLNHIRNRGIFIYNQDKACSYISYIFSKEVQNEVDEYEQKTFDMFKEFVNKYNTRPKHASNICPNDLIYVNSQMYVKMNTLYTLYEEYKRLLDENKFWDNNSCSAVHRFLKEYNEFIRGNQPNNKHYKHVLDHFEKEIERSVDIYRSYPCKNHRFFLEKIELLTLPEEQRPEESVQVQHRPNHADNQVTPAKIPTPHVEHQATREETRTSRTEPEISHEHPQPPQEGSLYSQEILGPSSHHAVQQEVQRLPREETHQRELHVDSSQVHPHHYGSLESSGELSYSEPNTYLPVLQSSNEAGDTSSSVMNTITSALRDVEPGPVLGVSGGMGVLFLLFKYTPVGSFFGGRRGRFRQIPSSFRGFPPGEFSNFQEYEGGYIGYGAMNTSPLAE